MPKRSRKDPATGSASWRKTITLLDVEGDVLQLVDLLQEVAFVGRGAYAIETALVWFAMHHGYIKGDAAVRIPKPAAETTQEEHREDLASFVEFAKAFGERLAYFGEQGRSVYMRASLAHHAMATAARFPKCQSPVLPKIKTECGEDRRYVLTFREEHLALADEVGKLHFNEKRIRRKVLSTAVREYAAYLSLTPTKTTPVFPAYPRPSLLRLNPYYGRYCLALTFALVNIGEAAARFKTPKRDLEPIREVMWGVGNLLLELKITSDKKNPA